MTTPPPVLPDIDHDADSSTQTTTGRPTDVADSDMTTAMPSEDSGLPTSPTTLEVTHDTPNPDNIPSPHNRTSHEITDFDVLGPDDIERMQARLQELGFIASDPSSSTSVKPHTPLESELASMVLRLISHHGNTENFNVSAQLEAQADAIAALTAQRDYLMTQCTLSCASWQVERDGWERSAEALIAQRAAAASITKEELVDRNIYRLEDENKRLREKLSESQQRVSVLETQLFNLRPLLLIPPVPPEPGGSPSRQKRPSTSQGPPTTQTSEADIGRTTRTAAAHDSAPVLHSQSVTGSGFSQPVDVAGPSGASHDDNRVESEATGQSAQASTPASSQIPFASQPSTSSQASAQPSTLSSPSRTSEYANRPRPTYYRTAKDYEISLARPRQTRSMKANPTHPLTSALSWLADQQGSAASSSGSSLGLGHGGNVGIGPAKKSSALMSDARAELVLAAARKMGKARASRVAGMLGIDVNKTVKDIRDERRAEVREEVHLVSEGWGKALEREQATEKDGPPSKTGKGKGRATEPANTEVERPMPPAPPKRAPRRKNPKKASSIPTLQVGAQPPPQTPLPPGNNGSYYASFHSMSHLVVLNAAHSGRMPSGSGVPLFVPVSSVWPHPASHPPHVAATPPGSAPTPPYPSPNLPSAQPVAQAAAPPSRPASAQNAATAPTPPPQQAQTNAARTPPKRTGSQAQGLDSLLNAARLLEHDEEHDSPGEDAPPSPEPAKRVVRRTRRSAAAGMAEGQGSPSKRRKVASPPEVTPERSASPPPAPVQNMAAPTRTGSFLDMLADQAMQEQERRPSTGPTARRDGDEVESRPGIGYRKSLGAGSRRSPGEAHAEDEHLRQRATVSEMRPSHSASRHNSPAPGRSVWQAPPHAPSPLAGRTREPTPHLSDLDAPGSPDDSVADGEGG